MRPILILLLAGLALGAMSPGLQAAGKKRPVASPPVATNGKRVIALEPVRNVRIEMPDQKFHDFGSDFQTSLTGRLTDSGRFIVADPPQRLGLELQGLQDSARDQVPPDYNWPGSLVPVATVKVKVEALSFQTGSRGERMFYGFNERFRTPFNNGFNGQANEFPLREVSFEPNWFDRTFDQRGSAPLDSHSGLDLGDGFKIDVLFAWLSVKYALYHSELRLRVDIHAPLAGINEFRLVQVRGEGYFFDIAGAYAGYSAGISVARRDAMDQALKNAIAGAYDAVDRAISGLPLTARVDAILPDGTLLLGTGPHSQVAPGVRYEVVDVPGVLVEINSSGDSGSVAHVASGDPGLVKLGAILREAGVSPPIPTTTPKLAGQAQMRVALNGVDVSVGSGPSEPSSASSASTPAVVESIDLPWTNLQKSNLDGLAPVVTWFQAFIKSLGELAFLPYRIWRYFSYDQVYHAQSDDDGANATHSGGWADEVRATDWAAQISLSSAAEMVEPTRPEDRPIVAIIDSGIDYNHWAIHSHLWINPQPLSIDGGGPATKQDRYGWDFISGDSHPYDDGYHGTEVASLVAGVAPHALLMPLKVFNPWGITTSAAMDGAFRYAVDHGAKIILCGWATRLSSHAIEHGVAYAHDHGVLVVAAAGDRGDVLSQVAAYPAALSRAYPNVLTVTGVSREDRLVQVQARYANSDPELVQLAAPGQDLSVANPRGDWTTDTSTGLAAAIAAGAVARLLTADPALGASGKPAEWIQKLRNDADVVPALAAGVQGGLRLRIRQ